MQILQINIETLNSRMIRESLLLTYFIKKSQSKDFYVQHVQRYLISLGYDEYK